MKKVLGIFALAAVVAIPGVSFAQTYAYVTTTGEVSSVEAATASAALATAPGIGIHSGVMLLESANDGIVGDSVPGI